MFNNLETKLKIGAIVLFVVGILGSIFHGVTFAKISITIAVLYIFVGVVVSWFVSAIIYAIATILEIVNQKKSYKPNNLTDDALLLSKNNESLRKK